jgi:segregation and condensation protein B
MSLKAKLEAVIYAAEEPVTLAQLASLFAADALEWKAQQEAASAEQAAEAEAAEPPPLLGLGEEFDYLEPEPSLEPGLDADSASAVPDGADSATETTAMAAGTVLKLDSVPSPESESGNEAAPSPAAPADPDSELKRLARLRDREVRAILRQLLDEIVASYASDHRGLEVREIAGGYRMATKPECHDAVRLFVKSLKPPLKLSLAALETLAVIAYKQPVTAPEVSEIRGVEAAGVLGSLLARKLIATAGRKQVIGRPILYKTTKEFLLRFGLKDVAELPSMEEFEKMASIELEEPESATGEENEFGAGVEDESSGGADLDSDPDSDAQEKDSDRTCDQSDPGVEPESAETTVDREETAAESPAPTPDQLPAETAAEKQAETPAEMAAVPSTATEPVSDLAPNPNE